MKNTLIDTTNFNGWSYADYLTFCQDNLTDPQGSDSNDFYTFLSERTAADVEDLFCNLEHSAQNSRPCRITGQLGLWWGSPVIEPVNMDNLSDAISRCIGSDGEDFTLTLEDGAIHVAVHHHDGTNNFQIEPVSGKYPAFIF